MPETLLDPGKAKPNEAELWPQGVYGLIGEEDEGACDLALCSG